VYDRVVLEIKPNSSPGFPYVLLASENRKLLDDWPVQIKSAVRSRIERILSNSAGYEDFSPADLIRRGFRDPDRYFPKKQAQRKAKALPRVIASASVVDQLVARCFFGEFTAAEGDAYPLLFTKKGIGFSESHAQLIGEQFASRTAVHGAPVVSDVSGWEKQFTPCLARAAIDVIRGCASDDSSSPRTGDMYLSDNIDRALSWWSGTLLVNLGYLDSGQLISFTDEKVQRSGNYLTTTSNGIARSVLAILAGSEPFCCGDDCNEWPSVSSERLKANYEEIRLPLRDVETGDGSLFKFCSHGFRFVGGKWICWLDSWQRMVWEASRNHKFDPGTNASWLLEIEQMEDCEDKRRIVEFIWRRAEALFPQGHDEENEECPD